MKDNKKQPEKKDPHKGLKKLGWFAALIALFVIGFKHGNK